MLVNLRWSFDFIDETLDELFAPRTYSGVEEPEPVQKGFHYT